MKQCHDLYHNKESISVHIYNKCPSCDEISEFGLINEIKNGLRVKKITQAEAAKYCNISRITLNRYLTGKLPAHFFVIYKLLEMLDLRLILTKRSKHI